VAFVAFGQVHRGDMTAALRPVDVIGALSIGHAFPWQSAPRAVRAPQQSAAAHPLFIQCPALTHRTSLIRFSFVWYPPGGQLPPRNVWPNAGYLLFDLRRPLFCGGLAAMLVYRIDTITSSPLGLSLGRP